MNEKLMPCRLNDWNKFDFDNKPLDAIYACRRKNIKGKYVFGWINIRFQTPPYHWEAMWEDFATAKPDEIWFPSLSPHDAIMYSVMERQDNRGIDPKPGDLSDSERVRIGKICKLLRQALDSHNENKFIKLLNDFYAISQQDAGEWTSEKPTEPGWYPVEIKYASGKTITTLDQWGDWIYPGVMGWYENEGHTILRHGPKINTTPPNKGEAE